MDPEYDWRWNHYWSPPSPGFPQPTFTPCSMSREDPGYLCDHLTSPRREPREEPPAKLKVNVPKGIKFDGKSDWQAFIHKFTSYADSEGWNSKTRKEVLCWVLQGTASEFYANLVKRNPALDYFDVVNKMAKRFDMQDLPETTQMLFASAVQLPKETLMEWCERISTLATQAFPDWTDEQISRQTVLRFCQGCADKEAGFHAITQKPRNLEDAVDKIKRYQHSSMAIYGQSQKGVRKVEEGEEECSRYSKTLEGNRCPPRTLTPGASSHNPELAERVDSLENSMASVIKSVQSLERLVKALEAKLALGDSSSLVTFKTSQAPPSQLASAEDKRQQEKVRKEETDEDLNGEGSEH